MGEKNNNKKDKIKFICFVIFIIAALVVVLSHWQQIKHIKIDKIADFLRSKGQYAVLVYLGIYALKPFFVVIPSNVIAIVGGIIFGPIKGFILSMTGFWISGTIAYYISRIMGKDFVHSILGKRFMKLDDNLKKDGFRILFLLRLPPVLPFDPLSYACGFTDISYKDFIIASLLGVVPETLCYSIMGPNFSNPLSPKFIIPLLVVGCTTLFSKKIMDLRKRKK